MRLERKLCILKESKNLKILLTKGDVSSMMNTYVIGAAVLALMVAALVVLGAIAAFVYSRRKHSEQLQEKFGFEYDHTVQTLGSEKMAQVELQERQNHVESLDIRPLTAEERDRYLADWDSVQTKFVDDPRQAIVDADHLIIEVMQMRNYPVSDFEQRAADISVNYPRLVNNYRSARVIAIKNKQNLADTEELRTAMIYYRSLFEELLETEPVVA
jgi:ABC-type multidrug transport system fused ATPase/permease subunit